MDTVREYRQRLAASLPERFQVDKVLSDETCAAVGAFIREKHYARAVEFGSGLGLPSAAVGLALRQPAVLYVLEPNTERAAIAEKALARLLPAGVEWEIIPGMTAVSGPAVLRTLKAIDYIRIETDDRVDVIVAAFSQAAVVVRPGGLVAGRFKGPGPKAALKTIRESSHIIKEIKLGELIGFEIK